MSPVVIILVSDGSRCLLARQASFPQGMYTALSGFCDVGEAASRPAQCPQMCRAVGHQPRACSQKMNDAWLIPQKQGLGQHRYSDRVQNSTYVKRMGEL